MTFTMEDEARMLHVFHIHPETSELTGESDVYIPPYTGLPAGCTTTEPPHIPEGFVALFDDVRQRWELAEDHRGKVVWNTASGDEIAITKSDRYLKIQQRQPRQQPQTSLLMASGEKIAVWQSA